MQLLTSYNLVFRVKSCFVIQNVLRRLKSDDIADGYQPKRIETESDVSERSKYSNIYGSRQNHSGRYASILPPPNVTGDLHLGHAFMATIQDVIARWKYSNGFDVLWIPGTDHAGIATQVVVEKKLQKELGQSRHDLGKELFLSEIWKWKEEKGNSIKSNLKRLGTTFDWDREYFTMDEAQTIAVHTAFIKLFENGLIYRQEMPINWSCALESAISNIEVDNLDLKGPTKVSVPGYKKPVQFGQISDIAYKRCDNDSEIVVSTTRPETLLGDTAIAVHPDDKRYSELRGQNIQLWHPFRQEPIPLIFDLAVDPAVGTGAVKVTPAHSKIDFAIAQRHSIQSKQVINEKGLITDGYDRFSGMPRFNARDEILNALGSLGLLRETRPHEMQLPICSRSGDVLEHLLKPQWFVRTEEMARSAVEAVEKGELKVHPSSFENIWRQWLLNNQDWCISRQLWWGHRIPAFECQHADKTVWVAAHNLKEACTKAAKQFNVNENADITVKRDEDVLDTWFSSALLPFSSLGWPNSTADLARYYPLDLLETGHDIFLFWVAKMVMLGKQLTGQLPFKSILLHGIIRDAEGRKMSKSKGNVILPEQIINGSTVQDLQSELDKSLKAGILDQKEYKKSITNIRKSLPKGIPECGTDALRFTLCSFDITDHYIDFSVDQCFTNKKFFNKIWNATKFTLSNCHKLDVNPQSRHVLNDANMTEMDRWILSRLAATTIKFEAAMDEHNFGLATFALKRFLYQNMCDVYLECTKLHLASEEEPFASNHCLVLLHCLSVGMVHLSHFTPFLAKELTKYLPMNMIEFEPQKWVNTDIEEEVARVLDICAAVRQVKSENNITKKHGPDAYLFSEDPKTIEAIEKHNRNINQLTFSTNVLCNQHPPANQKFVVESVVNHLCSFGVTTSVPVEATAIEINRKKLEFLQLKLDGLLAIVSQEKYIKRASQEVKLRDREKITRFETEIAAIKKIK